MKKELLALAFIAMLFATSCNKNNGNNPVDIPEGSFLATIANDYPMNAPKVDDSNMPKTTINGNIIYWEHQDEISINGAKYVADATGDNVILNPSGGTAQPDAGGYFHAIYPYGCQTTGNMGNLPANQTFDPEKTDSRARLRNVPLYGKTNNNNLEFHNIFAVIKFHIPSYAAPAKSVVISSDQLMNGEFEVVEQVVNETTKYVAQMTGTATDDRKSITISKESGTMTKDDILYIALPGTSYSNLTFTITTQTEVVYKKNIGNLTLNTNQLYNVNVDYNLLPGKFTVNGSNKQVFFAKSNMYSYYSDDSQQQIFKLESSQILNSSEFSANHINHFYWADNVEATVTQNSIENSSYYIQQFNAFYYTTNNVTANGTSTLTCLTKDEWDYLINTRTNHENLYKCGVTVESVENCLIIAPDNFTGKISNSYSTEKEVTEAGLVCLRDVGSRNGATVTSTTTPFRYWTGTKSSTDNNKAICMEISNTGVSFVEITQLGLPIRLVKVVTTSNN